MRILQSCVTSFPTLLEMKLFYIQLRKEAKKWWNTYSAPGNLLVSSHAMLQVHKAHVTTLILLSRKPRLRMVEYCVI